MNDRPKSQRERRQEYRDATRKRKPRVEWKPARHRSKVVPDWMKDPIAVEEFLARRFPEQETSAQRQARNKYSCAIDEYARGKSAAAIAATWLWNPPPPAAPVARAYIHRLIQRIKRAYAGLRLDGRPRSYGKAGRPRKPKESHGSL